MPTFLTGAVGVQLQRDLGFGATELGAAIAASLAVSFLGSVAFGRQVQRHGWTTGMRFAAAVAALSMGGIAWLADSWIPLALLLVLGGIAKSAGHPAANLAIAAESPRHRQGILFGIKQAGVPAAAMLGGLSVPLVVLDHGWRAAFGIAALLSLAFILFVPRRPRQVTAGLFSRSTKSVEPETRRLALIVLAAGAGSGVAVSNSVAAFLTTYSVQIGLSEGAAGMLLALASFSGLAGRVLIGWLSDRVDLGFGTVALLLTSGGVGIAMMTTQLPVLVAVGAVVSFGAGWAWAGIFNLAVVRQNPSAPAVATGYTQAGVYAGAGIGPFLFGVVADAASFVAAWWMVALVAAIAAVIMLVGGRASPSAKLSVAD
jgi:cyanate permease